MSIFEMELRTCHLKPGHLKPGQKSSSYQSDNLKSDRMARNCSDKAIVIPGYDMSLVPRLPLDIRIRLCDNMRFRSAIAVLPPLYPALY